ncbi:hypothetical protein CBS9595_002934 [Malassezia furfur]|nr:hypothetical protein CBS9595_002934 [Malassezia furfur]
MRPFHVFFLLCSALAAAATLTPLHPRAFILSPENDPFYQPPAGWEDKEPGTVLRSRRITPTLLTFDNINVEHAYQLLYRTTGTYESDAAVTATTILVPYNAKKNKLVAHLTYVDADGSKCALSYGIRKGSQFPGDVSMDYQLLLLEQILEAGYIMTLPDYQGMNRAFGVGPLSGRQTLDGIKATLSFERLGLNQDTPVVTSGYSGGAIASSWSAALHPTYASSINAKGFAMGGTPANLTGTVINLDGGPFAAFAIAGVVGLMYTYDDLLNWVNPRLTPKGSHAVEFARSTCVAETYVRYPFSRVLSEDFIRGGTHLLQVPVVERIMSTLTLGVNKSLTPSAPVFMYHGRNDEVIPYRDALVTARLWAEHGANVLFHTDAFPTLGHATTELANLPNLLFFIEDRFADKPFAEGLQHEVVWNPLEGNRAKQQGLGSIVEIIKNILGDKIGPKTARAMAARLRNRNETQA